MNNPEMSPEPPVFLVRPDGKNFIVRRREASNVRDPFVEVTVDDDDQGADPLTRLSVEGVRRYSDYETHGDKASVGLGKRVHIQVTVEHASDSRKTQLAERFAAIVFQMSTETQD